MKKDPLIPRRSRLGLPGCLGRGFVRAVGVAQSAGQGAVAGSLADLADWASGFQETVESLSPQSPPLPGRNGPETSDQDGVTQAIKRHASTLNFRGSLMATRFPRLPVLLFLAAYRSSFSRL